MRNKMQTIMGNLVDLLVAIAVTLLGLRFFLKLFDANASNDFVDWVYRSSGDVLAPFRNIFPAQEVGGGSIVEFSTLFAMVVYGLVGMLMIYLINFFGADDTPKSRRRK